MHFPPYVREVWDWLLMKANHTDRKTSGTVVKRGQLFTTLDEIRDGLCWYIGYRKMSYTKDHMKKAMKALKKSYMIDTTKSTRGLLITICNYDFFQNPKNYESTNESTDKSDALRKPNEGSHESTDESTDESTTHTPVSDCNVDDNSQLNKYESTTESTDEAPSKHQGTPTINKNDKNYKNGNIKGELEIPNKSKPKKIGTRLSEDWWIPDEWGDWVVKEFGWDDAKVVKVTEEFHDHWISVSGNKGVKLNWSATWRNWCRREQDGVFK